MSTKSLESSSRTYEVSGQSGPEPQNGSVWQNFKDSFKPADQVVLNLDDLDDVEKANLRAANSQLLKKLKNRHLQMIAIGGSIGTGLFVGSGSALSTGGPGGIVIAWAITATFVFTTMQGLGELSTTFPISGGFNIYATRFIEPAVGFAIGWNYFLQFFVLLPLELVAASISIQYWNADLNPDIFVAIFWVLVFAITMMGVRWYGEAEFIFSMIKVVTVIGFIILGIVLICGGGPTHDFVGGRYWRNPGAFANGFKGVCSVWVTAAFSFGGTEMIGLGAAEAANPAKALPKAIKQVFLRITIFYLGTIVVIATLVPYDDSRLLNATSSADASVSPFVIAIVNGGIQGLPSVINAVILIAVLSVGNASVYACSRSLNSLAEQGMAPKWTGYVDRKGRPLFAIIITNLFGLFAFIAASDKQDDAFNWLLALSGLSSIFTWMSINFSHIRFRAAMKQQGRSLDELVFRSASGVLGSWYGLVMNFLVLVATFWLSLFPLHEAPNASSFFQGYLGLPTILLSWIGYKIYSKSWRMLISADKIDLDTGRHIPDMDLIRQEEAEMAAELANQSWWRRALAYIF
ncbi:amino acid permease [Metschnikowia bicuspidata var. bicuspidata NRRL YB-4993]|uniref:Amino acid permease n=1 Tax=Metschnikowia bicuspidata var. bicuspidata NRRL YB-4993 TaxID=869754 RepID=A0A1A0H8M2_9ASCO|nr:amino acid permease [Metschnikowia bicuspidata var. bicuspidata NRRL YB-4993]OBA20233.1 amino acid permease [Metschnikowia bicuspidata var. bicuspidata NRRL YB-4993]